MGDKHFVNISVYYMNSIVTWLQVRDGGSADSPLIRRACGRDLPSAVVSTSHQLYILFHSDYSVAYRGFRAVYQVGESATHCFHSFSIYLFINFAAGAAEGAKINWNKEAHDSISGNTANQKVCLINW